MVNLRSYLRGKCMIAWSVLALGQLAYQFLAIAEIGQSHLELPCMNRNSTIPMSFEGHAINLRFFCRGWSPRFWTSSLISLDKPTNFARIRLFLLGLLASALAFVPNAHAQLSTSEVFS